VASDEFVLKEKTKAWLALADRLLLVCEGVLHQAKIPEQSDTSSNPKVYALALLLRTINNFGAMRVLLEQGFIVEARTMARCCYENLFWIGGLTGKGEKFVEQIIKAHAEGQLKTGNALLEWAKKQETPLHFEGSLSTSLDTLKAEKPKGAVDYKGGGGRGEHRRRLHHLSGAIDRRRASFRDIVEQASPL
jgi:hypothetical protein